MFVPNCPTLNFEGIDNLALSAETSCNFSIMEEGFRYDGYFGSHKGDFLFVALHGAVDRDNPLLKPPIFARWNWSRVLGGPVLSLADPMLHAHRYLRLSWYIGTEAHDVTANIVRIVRRVASALGYPLDRVVFYSGSAGGFASLCAAARLPVARVVAINPQTTDLGSTHKGQMRDFLRVFSPGGITREEAAARFPLRFSAIEAFRETVARGSDYRLIYVQDTRDTTHVVGHFTPFQAAIGGSTDAGFSAGGRVLTMFYSHGEVHGREPIAITKKILREVNGANGFFQSALALG